MTHRVAIVHDYLTQAGGAERVVGTLHSMFPEAPIYTSILDRDSLWPSLRDADIRTSFMQKLPGVLKHFKTYLPLYPIAIESFDLSQYDLVISSSSAFAKGARAAPNARHICYCYTPMRFAWEHDRYMQRESYGAVTRALLPPVIRRLREWDVRTAAGPTQFVAISSVVAERIQRCYGRTSEVIPAPVDVGRYAPSSVDRDYFLVVSRLVPYKRIDLVIDAFTLNGKPLVVIGDGPDRHGLEHLAGPNIQFLGRLPDAEVARYYAECRAVIFPGEEDFGLVPLEANASGRPVIAFGGGGVLDTVLDGETGVLFTDQSVDSLNSAISHFESMRWDQQKLLAHAEEFSEGVFKRRIRTVVDRATRSAALVTSHPLSRAGKIIDGGAAGVSAAVSRK